MLLQDQGDLAAARPLYERALAIREKALGPEHPDTATSLNNLAVLLQDQGDLAAARPLYERALAIGEKALGPEHPDTATSLNNLALLLQEQGDLAAARPLYERALAIREKALGPEHPDTSRARWYLARVLSASGYAREALQLQEVLAAEEEAAETKREGKPGKATASALHAVAWYALFAREFTRALSVADRAHALLPDNLDVETNRAHALMFLDRQTECRALYLAHKGKPMSEQDSSLWERVIADDFAKLRKAGLTHPTMADIERELGVSR